jgi:hypothetical protein
LSVSNFHDVDRQVSCLRVTDAQPLVVHSPNCIDNQVCPYDILVLTKCEKLVIARGFRDDSV